MVNFFFRDNNNKIIDINKMNILKFVAVVVVVVLFYFGSAEKRSESPQHKTRFPIIFQKNRKIILVGFVVFVLFHFGFLDELINYIRKNILREYFFLYNRRKNIII